MVKGVKEETVGRVITGSFIMADMISVVGAVIKNYILVGVGLVALTFLTGVIVGIVIGLELR
jgi:uncharacterized membrane protein YraQ (UPF0718 family)